ncbi:hypothetical protein ACFVIM_19385 [Streptomyces sp. NPDC057638]|uniref:hypothetical protein n=1 Tax=Streptomyces sp. NPDC057638 TaxID=3346190 RepID=UPI0036C980EB
MFTYSGSGPYCYTHAMAMAMGSAAPAPAVIETLTGSPFGMHLLGGTLPLFDPLGWDPEAGIDAALGLLGWECARDAGGTAEQALDRLRKAAAPGPVVVGPVDMGLLLYQPGTPWPRSGDDTDAADHYVVVVEVSDDTVVLHDPHGHPFATLPVPAFLAAWRAESVPYTDEPYIMRHSFTRDHVVDERDALRAMLPRAVAWLDGTGRGPAGSVHGAEAARALAERVRQGLAPHLRSFLEVFAVRVGARRLADASGCLTRLGLADAAAVAADQARVLGGLQYPLVTGDDHALASGLLRLAPLYGHLRTELARALAD